MEIFQDLEVSMWHQFRMIMTITLGLMMMMRMIIQVDNKKMLEMIVDIAMLKSIWMISIKKKKKVSKSKLKDPIRKKPYLSQAETESIKSLQVQTKLRRTKSTTWKTITKLKKIFKQIETKIMAYSEIIFSLV